MASQDPTQTITLRQRYEAAFYKKFRYLKGLIRTTVEENDALRIGARYRRGRLAQPRDDFNFEENAQKQAAFEQWLQTAIEEEILQPVGETALLQGQHYTGSFVRATVRKAIELARTRLQKIGIELPDTSVDVVMNRPIHKSTLAMMYRRHFRALEGVTQAMDKEMSRTLTEGLSQGWHPRKMANKLNDRVDKVGITRARTVAQTETIRTHAESTLNSYERSETEQVVKESEFSDSDDERVCEECEDLDGTTYTTEEARGVIPQHPNCRCSWLPVI
jgi:SPP1 gp7 family putative phage head morphogenesis protein